MFPKFLKLTGGPAFKVPDMWVNETHYTEKTVLYYRDQTILDIYARALGFSYEFEILSSEMCLRSSNGSWTGMLGMLQRNEVDMVVGDFTLHEEFHGDFRTSYPELIEEITFMTKKQEQVPNPAVFFQPFSNQVWLSIIACIFMIPFLFRKLLRRKHSLPSLFASTLGSLVGQGMGITPRRRRDYIVLASWIIGSAFLCHFYSAVLLSFLTFPSMEGIRTVEDLSNGIKDGKYQCSTDENAIYAAILSRAPIPSAQVIGNNLDGYDEHCFNYLETPVGEKKRAFVSTRSHFDSFKNFYFISEENFFSVYGVYIMRKDFCCSEELDKVTHRLWASGIFQRISAQLSDYYFDLFLKTEYLKIKKPEGKLTMTHLKGPFIFLIVSHSLAFLVFLIEVCIGKFKKI